MKDFSESFPSAPTGAEAEPQAPRTPEIVFVEGERDRLSATLEAETPVTDTDVDRGLAELKKYNPPDFERCQGFLNLFGQYLKTDPKGVGDGRYAGRLHTAELSRLTNVFTHTPEQAQALRERWENLKAALERFVQMAGRFPERPVL